MPFNDAAGFRAGGTIAPSRFVTIDPSEDGQVVESNDGDVPIGISQEGMKNTPGLVGSDTDVAANDGDVIKVYSLGDVCGLVLGDTVTRGNLLKSDNSGRGVPASSGNQVGAIALQSGAVGNIINVQILSRTA